MINVASNLLIGQQPMRLVGGVSDIEQSDRQCVPASDFDI